MTGRRAQIAASLKRDDRCYEEGVEARRAGKPYEACPYQPMDLMGRMAWGWGWKQQDRKMGGGK